MKNGYLSDYFDGVASKTLTVVETDITRSNQREFNGVSDLKKLLGTPTTKQEYLAKFIYLTDYEDDPLTEDVVLSWYDSRAGQTKRSAEFRLYYQANEVSSRASDGDLLVIAKTKQSTLLAIIAEQGTTIATQLQWLFSISNLDHPGFSVREELETDQDRIGFVTNLILEAIGIEVDRNEPSHLDKIVAKFGYKFPTTREFSKFARDSLPDISAADSPDQALFAWLEREEILFRTLERHILGERLAEGFSGNDVDAFISFSLSVQNRRKSRIGYALEHHLEQVFIDQKLKYSRGAKTEGNAKPDFLFPGVDKYLEENSDPRKLTMLGVKSSCKERWRQILPEAARIKNKHLFTLEPSISVNQTDQMKEHRVSLVIPQKIHKTFAPDQQEWLINLENFISETRSRGQ